MALDGIFLHHLINEIKEDVENKKIYRISAISDTDYAFYLQNKKTLLLSLNPSSSHIRLTSLDYLPSATSLSSYLKKHIEGGIITSINQIENDRLVLITINAFDDLGYNVKYKIYLELMGKNSNMIITNENDIILEAIKKSYLTDTHLIKSGVKYRMMLDNKMSPFTLKEFENIDLSSIQGLSKQAINEINDTSLYEFINKTPLPTLIKGEKIVFYCFDLKTIFGERRYFNTLSSLLEYYYTDVRKLANETQDLLNTRKFLSKELDKAVNKLEKQKIEYENAKDNDKLLKYADLLKANYYLLKPYMESITLTDYENGNKISIPLNKNLKPNENIEYYYNKIKKNKRTILFLKDKILETKKEIDYYNTNLLYLDYSKVGDLKEIMIELGLRKSPNKNSKPHLSKYKDNDGNLYYFGKNNVQNNYLTHVFASKDDYWFHVKSIPGSHVILKGELNEETIKKASNIAAYYSKARESVHVCVDYTQIKWVKKIKGEIGSNCIYTHEKTYYSDPSIDFINSNLKLE